MYSLPGFIINLILFQHLRTTLTFLYIYLFILTNKQLHYILYSNTLQKKKLVRYYITYIALALVLNVLVNLFNFINKSYLINTITTFLFCFENDCQIIANVQKVFFPYNILF